MTVILAVPCADGTVIASDGQGTDTSGAAGNLGIATKMTVEKLYPLGTHVVWGGTGNAGAIQRLDYELRQLPSEAVAESIDVLRTTLRSQHIRFRQQLIAEAQMVGAQPLTVAALYAGYTAGGHWILEVSATGEDTVYTEPYAIGSGGTFANQAMAAVGHFDLPGRSLAEAQVIAWRALDGCIAASAFGIGHPIRMFSVTARGTIRVGPDDARTITDSVNTWKATELEALGSLGLGRVAVAPEPLDEVGLEAPGSSAADELELAPEAARSGR